MANYSVLKGVIENAIYTNGNNEITGEILQAVLLSMVNSLGNGYQYKGIATPTTTPGTPDNNVYYFATTVGTYTNFNAITVAAGEIAILKYNGTWVKDSVPIADVGIINVTTDYPLGSGYYQITDSSAPNYAPSVVPVGRRKQGCILKIETSSLHYELYLFNGNAADNVSWNLPNRWTKLANGAEVTALNTKLNKLVYNLTVEVPLSSGQYQMDDPNAANYAPSAVPSAIREPGLILLFRKGTYKWETWQYNSLTTDAFTNLDRWVCLSALDKANIVAASFASGDLEVSNVRTNSSLNALFDGFTLGLNIPKAAYYKIPQLQVNSTGKKNIIKADNNGITLLDIRHANKIYFVTHSSGSWILLNPDETYDVELSNMVNKELTDDLEIGYIDSTTFMDGSLNTRLRTRAGLLYKSPITLNIKDGYVLNGEIKINPITGVSQYAGKAATGKYTIPEDGLLRRFVFRKADNTAFSTVEDVAGIVFVDNYNNLANKPSVNGQTLQGDITIAASRQDRVDLNNAETLLLVGTSHTEGNGSLLDKSMASYISALTDWDVFNFGDSGSNYIKHLSKILNDDATLSGAKWSDIISGGVCLDFLCSSAENIFAVPPMDGKYSAENMRRLYNLLQTKGFEIIAGSYWGDEPISLSDVQKKVAKEMNLPTIDLNTDLYRINDKDFLPFWYNAHFGSRTVANQFFTLLQKYQIRRPRKAIKVFRNRVSGASINTLLYNDNFERLKNWRELSVGHRYLTNGRENYVDRLDLYAEQYNLSSAPREYVTLRKGNDISFADKALIEFILPATAGNIRNLKLFISTSADNANVYIMKYQDSSLALTLEPASAVFIISDGVTGISVGDVFTDTLNSGVTFTVTAVDSSSNRILCTASGTFVTPGQTTDVLTRQSDSQTFTASSLTSGVPSGYPSEAFTPFGKWEALTKTDGYYSVSTPSLYMKYDKVAILVDNQETAFTIDDVYATFENNGDKQTEPLVSVRYPKMAATKIFEDSFDDTVGTIDDTHGSYIWDGKESYVNGSSQTVIKNHIPPYYRQDITKILHLKTGDKVTYDISGFVSQDQGEYNHYRITIVARYFPASNLDISAASFTITPNSFDFSKLGIKYNIGSSAVETSEKIIPASFVTLYDDIYFDAKHNGTSLELMAIDDDVEILLIQVDKIS